MQKAEKRFDRPNKEYAVTPERLREIATGAVLRGDFLTEETQEVAYALFAYADLLKAQAPPEATAVHGTIWVVMNEGNPELACGWPEGAHEHINDAIQHDIEGAAQWVVREYVPMICAEHDWRDEKEFVSCKRCHTTFAKRDLPSSTPVEPQGWQPIETAPADTDVLLYCPDRHYTNPERVELGQAKNTKGGSAHSWATHWMPLPSVPLTKAGS